MESFIADLRFIIRQLLRHRLFTLAAVLTLALAVGANTAIFSVVSGVLLRPLPFPDPRHLVTVCERHESVAGFCIASPPDVEDWAAASRTIASIGLGRDWSFSLGTGTGPEWVAGGYATPGLFRALGVDAESGRVFAPDEVGPGASVAILNDAVWRTRFGADSTLLGGTITLDGKPYTVVGIMPAGFQVPGLERVEVWTPLPFSPRDEENRRWRGFHVFARLAPGATPAAAGLELAAIQRGLSERFPDTNRGWGVEVLDLHQSLVGDVKGRLYVFLGAAGLVLLLGCANLANMLLARTTARAREIAIRAAVGASRGRVLRLLLLESSLLAVIGSAAGLFLAAWATKALLGLAPAGIPRLDQVGVDWRVVSFAAFLAAATMLLFGLMPALRGSSSGGESSIRPSGLGGPRSRVRGMLVAAETAIAVTLLIGAGLLTRSFATLVGWSPGFAREHLALGSVALSTGTYADGAAVRATFSRALETLRATPGLEAVSLASAGPLFGGTETGTAEAVGGDSAVVRWYDAGPRWFTTLGLPLLRGRDFTDQDREGAPLVAIVNETLARRLWPGADPVGRQVRMTGDEPMVVIGVVPDVPNLNPDQPTQAELWWPFLQKPRWAAFVVTRSVGTVGETQRLIARRLADVAPDVAPTWMRSLDDMMDRQLVSPRFSMFLIGAFAVVAMALAAVGLGSVIAYGVAARTREIGLRVALGATAGGVTGRFVLEGLRLVGAGTLLGVAGALALTRFLQSMLAGTSPTDPATIAAIVGVMTAAGAMAAWLPARRAGRVDPLTALRAE